MLLRFYCSVVCTLVYEPYAQIFAFLSPFSYTIEYYTIVRMLPNLKFSGMLSRALKYLQEALLNILFWSPPRDSELHKRREALRAHLLYQTH